MQWVALCHIIFGLLSAPHTETVKKRGWRGNIMTTNTTLLKRRISAVSDCTHTNQIFSGGVPYTSTAGCLLYKSTTCKTHNLHLIQSQF